MSSARYLAWNLSVTSLEVYFGSRCQRSSCVSGCRNPRQISPVHQPNVILCKTRYILCRENPSKRSSYLHHLGAKALKYHNILDYIKRQQCVCYE